LLWAGLCFCLKSSHMLDPLYRGDQELFVKLSFGKPVQTLDVLENESYLETGLVGNLCELFFHLDWIERLHHIKTSN
jgi:hypothetical protein